ncbi:glycosyltransferase 87 family protein [Actinokineospora sp. 24-640]
MLVVVGRGKIIGLWVLLALAGAAAAAVIHTTTGRFWLDLGVYRHAGEAVLSGESPYTFTDFGERANALRYVYPPFAAVLFLPLAVLGATGSVFGWTAVSLLALFAVVWMALGAPEARQGIAARVTDLADPRRRALAAVVVAGVCLPLYPVLNNLQVGQVNILLMAIVLADVLGLVPARLRGVGVGIAAAVKLTPAIFVVYLLCTGRVRDALRAVGTFAATVAVGFAVLPSASWVYWTSMFADSARVTDDPRTINNQSVQAALARLSGVESDYRLWWLALALVIGGAGIAVAVRAARRGAALTGVVLCAVTGLLVSPVSWQHHWVWLVPLLLLVAARTAVVLYALILSTALYMVVSVLGVDNEFGGPMLVYSNLYVLIGLGVLAAAGVRELRSPAPRAAGPARHAPS